MSQKGFGNLNTLNRGQVWPVGSRVGIAFICFGGRSAAKLDRLQCSALLGKKFWGFTGHMRTLHEAEWGTAKLVMAWNLSSDAYATNKLLNRKPLSQTSEKLQGLSSLPQAVLGGSGISGSVKLQAQGASLSDN